MGVRTKRVRPDPQASHPVDCCVTLKKTPAWIKLSVIIIIIIIRGSLMKFLKLSVLSLIMGLWSMHALAAMQPLASAGDIAEGRAFLLSEPQEMGYYTKDGKEGNVTFTCRLTRDASDDGSSEVGVGLYTGKNFDTPINKGARLILEAGKTQLNFGPYTWKLIDSGKNVTNGNIKLMLLQGTNVTVQCKEGTEI